MVYIPLVIIPRFALCTQCSPCRCGRRLSTTTTTTTSSYFECLSVSLWLESLTSVFQCIHSAFTLLTMLNVSCSSKKQQAQLFENRMSKRLMQDSAYRLRYRNWIPAKQKPHNFMENVVLFAFLLLLFLNNFSFGFFSALFLFCWRIYALQ